MKRFFLSVLLMTSTFCFSQELEWMRSFDIAKRLALTQNKMLLVMWEEAANDFYIYNGRGIGEGYENILKYEGLKKILWEKYVPVIINESHYEALFKTIEGKQSLGYISRFNNDTIKIMDANGTIFTTIPYEIDELYRLITELGKYAIDTSFLEDELRNYSGNKNFSTAYRLSAKYMDYAAYQNKKLERLLTNMSIFYLEEAKRFLPSVDEAKREAFSQKCELLRLSQYLNSNRPRKVLRSLKVMEETTIHDVNESIHAFLKYTSYMLLEDEENALLWKNKVSLFDLKKAEMLINKNT